MAGRLGGAPEARSQRLEVRGEPRPPPPVCGCSADAIQRAPMGSRADLADVHAHRTRAARGRHCRLSGGPSGAQCRDSLRGSQQHEGAPKRSVRAANRRGTVSRVLPLGLWAAACSLAGIFPASLVSASRCSSLLVAARCCLSLLVALRARSLLALAPNRRRAG